MLALGQISRLLAPLREGWLQGGMVRSLRRKLSQPLVQMA